MIRVFFITLLISFSANAQTAPVVVNGCTESEPIVCAEIVFVNTPNTTDEGEFSLVLNSSNHEVLQNVKVDLWMQMGNHGHGSAPLQLTNVADNTYKVENAWFVMTGKWQVRVDFTVAGQSLRLKLPVLIQQ
jgi:hypothetical protein